MFRNSKSSKRWIVAVGGVTGLAASGWLLHGQDLFSDFQYAVPHSECAFFGPKHDSFVVTGYNGQGIAKAINSARTGLTDAVVRQIPSGVATAEFAAPGGSTTKSATGDTQLGPIDKY